MILRHSVQLTRRIAILSCVEWLGRAQTWLGDLAAFARVIARSTCDEAIHCHRRSGCGLLRFARNDGQRRFAPRNDGKTRLRDLAAALRPSFCKNHSPKKFRGRRECRVPNAPTASRAK